MARSPVPYRSGRGGRTRSASVMPMEMRTEIASTLNGRDITQPYIRGLREPRDPLLWGAVDWGIYRDILRDDQVFSTLQQRIGAVVSRDWNIIPGDESDPRSVAAAQRINQTIERIGWDRITRMMLYATVYGYSVAEIIWEVRDGFWDFGKIRVKHGRRFRWDEDNRLRLLTPANTQGEVLPERKFWVHTVGADNDDEPYGMGLAHWLYWPVVFKRNGLRFWNIYLDKFGTPTAVAKYPRGSSKQDVQNLLAALQAMATDSGIVVPEGVAVDLLNAARSGTGDFATLYDKMDAAITKIVLSQTMTTDNGSSRSQAEVHGDVKLEVVKSDADLMSDSFNAGPARWWTDYNYGSDVAAPQLIRVVEEEEDTKAAAETDKIHAENGWVRTADSFADTYGEGYVRKDDPNAPSGYATETTPDEIGHNGVPALDPEDDPSTDPAAGDNPKGDRRKPASFAADDPRPLYVYRRLINAADVLAWAREQGFDTLVAPEDLHVTITYSKKPVNWFAIDNFGSFRDELIVGPGGPRLVETMGGKGAVALCFQSPDLQWRHREMMEAGCSWDFPSYIPHITLTYDASGVDLAKVQPWTGRLIFGPEIYEPIEQDWKPVQRSAASFAEQPGDIIDQSVDDMIAQDGFKVVEAMTGNIMERLLAAETEEAARTILSAALGAMDDAPLVQALERAGFALRFDAANQPATTKENDA